MKRLVIGSIIAAAAFLLTAPGNAHHSFVAVFDPETPVDITGTVTKVEWMNPHTWFYADVENENGEIENWGFEMGTPNMLVRRGWSIDTLQIGQVVTVVGFLARERPQTAAVRSVTLSTGERLFGAQDESK